MTPELEPSPEAPILTEGAPIEPQPESAPAAVAPPDVLAAPDAAVPSDSVSPNKAAAGAGAAVDLSGADYGAQHTDVFQECAAPDCHERDDRHVVFGGLSLVLCEAHRTEDGLRRALGL